MPNPPSRPRTPASRPRVRRLAPLAVVLVLVTVTAACQTARVGRRCRGGTARDATHVLVCRNGRWARLGTFRDVLLALEESGRPAVVFTGDSIAMSMDDELGEVLRPRGVRYFAHTYPCGVIEGYSADPSGTPWPMARACAPAVPRVQEEFVAARRPDLVVVVSSWEHQDRVFEGAWDPYGTPASDERILALYRRTIDRLTASGARVVLTLLPDHVRSQIQPAQAHVTTRIRHLNELLAEVARRDPARVSLIRMDDLVCPTVDPCPDAVDGIGMRTVDGVHFDGPAAARHVAERLVDRILAVPFGNGRQVPPPPVPTTAPPAPTTSTSSTTTSTSTTSTSTTTTSTSTTSTTTTTLPG